MHAPNAAYYEVYCPRCRVSFPLGTRRCLHCGGPVGRERGRPQRGEHAEPLPAMDELPEEELPGRSGVLSPMAVVWLLLVVGGALYRTCS